LRCTVESEFSRLEIVEDWGTKFRKGVIYYLRNNRVRGVLLWNTFGLVNAARALIGSQQRVPAHDLVAQVRQARPSSAVIGITRCCRVPRAGGRNIRKEQLPGGHMNRQVSRGSGWSWWYLLFLIQFVAVLWPPFFNRAEPSWIGMPFFYWYQLLWVIIGAILTAIVYFATDE
jgi:hypothetical protein